MRCWPWSHQWVEVARTTLTNQAAQEMLKRTVSVQGSVIIQELIRAAAPVLIINYRCSVCGAIRTERHQ